MVVQGCGRERGRGARYGTKENQQRVLKHRSAPGRHEEWYFVQTKVLTSEAWD